MSRPTLLDASARLTGASAAIFSALSHAGQEPPQWLPFRVDDAMSPFQRILFPERYEG